MSRDTHRTNNVYKNKEVTRSFLKCYLLLAITLRNRWYKQYGDQFQYRMWRMIITPRNVLKLGYLCFVVPGGSKILKSFRQFWYRGACRVSELCDQMGNISWLRNNMKRCFIPDSKVHGANMGPIWDRQDPVGPHDGPWTLLSGILYWNGSPVQIAQATYEVRIHKSQICFKSNDHQMNYTFTHVP